MTPEVISLKGRHQRSTAEEKERGAQAKHPEGQVAKFLIGIQSETPNRCLPSEGGAMGSPIISTVVLVLVTTFYTSTRCLQSGPVYYSVNISFK